MTLPNTPQYGLILSANYPALRWKMEANDYATIVLLEGTGPLPAQADLDAAWPTVKANVEAALVDAEQQSKLLIDAGAILKGFDIVAETLSDLVTAAATKGISVNRTRLDALRAKIAAAKS